MPFEMPNLAPAYPETFLLVAASVILLVDLMLPDRLRHVTYALSQLTILVCALLTVGTFNAAEQQSIYTFSNMFVADRMAVVLKLFTYIAVAGCFVYSRVYLEQRGMFQGEFFVLALFAMLGMMVMISSNHFLTLYLGLELLSLCLYAMVALNRDSATSTEAAMKYFVLGALASGLLLYGMSMLYGATGSLEIRQVSDTIASGGGNATVLVFGLVFVVAGLAFKIGVVPFHMWLPDVYHGAPNAMTLFIGSAPKIAAFAMAIRLLVNGLLPLAEHWQQMLALMAVLSFAIGNLAAIAQTNYKRMLAYSTISHMGFMLLGLLSGIAIGTGAPAPANVPAIELYEKLLEANRTTAQDAYSAAMFYTVTYVIISLGALGMTLVMSRAGFEAEELSDFKGLNQRHPWLAFLTLIFMFALAGVPPTVGFYAKLAVLQAAVSAGHVTLAVIAVVFSLIGAFYYLRVVKLMYFDEPEERAALKPALDIRTLVTINGLAVLLLGILPQGLMELCLQSIKALAV
jgi:NADH-quinone oxidoreductase subunit N